MKDVFNMTKISKTEIKSLLSQISFSMKHQDVHPSFQVLLIGADFHVWMNLYKKVLYELITF